MVKNEKFIEMYFDSKKYNNQDVLNNIKKVKKEYANKDISVKIDFNDWGVYVITLSFKDKDNYLKKLKSKFKNKKYKMNYGVYKKTGMYKPY